MAEYQYTIKITAESEEEANQVMAERLDHDEDYGFTYVIDEWRINFSGDTPCNFYDGEKECRATPTTQCLYLGDGLYTLIRPLCEKHRKELNL